VKRCSRIIRGGASGETFVVRGQKVFVSTLENRTFSIKVLDRLKPDKEPGMWILPESYGPPCASLATYKDFMAILRQPQQETDQFSERVLWVLVLDGRDETSFWLDNSQMAQFDITPDNFRPEKVALSKNLLAVCGYTSVNAFEFDYRLFLWKVNTSETTSGSSPHVLGVLKVPGTLLGPSELLVNEKFFLILNDQLICDGLFEIVVIEKTKLLIEDETQLAEKAKLIDPKLPGNPWRLLKVGSSHDNIYDEEFCVYLEPGKSSRLGIYKVLRSVFIILDLTTGAVTCQVPLTDVYSPACWYGGNFLFCKALQPVSKKTEQSSYNEQPGHHEGDIQEQCFGTYFDIYKL
jgi:hypothetical protein